MPAVAVFYVLGWLFSAMAFAMLLPAIFAAALDSIRLVQAFLAPAIVIGFLGGCMIFTFKGQSQLAGRRQSLLLLALVWLVLPIAGALPLHAAGYPKGLMDAIFEAVSGFTTTGASVFIELAEVPRSIIIWRALLQWMGGLTTLLALAAIVGPLAGADLLDRQLRLIGRSTHGTTRHMSEAVNTILPLYLALTMGCFAALILTGIPPIDAFCLALSTVSTGGFMPREGTIALYGSPTAEVILAIFMFIGGVSVFWVRALLQGRWPIVRETREPYWMLFLIVASGIAISILLLGEAAGGGFEEFVHGLTIGLATAASLISTTGFAISVPAQEFVPYMAVLGIAIIGGGRFSTAGGLKIYRVIAMLRQIGRELRILVFPHGVRPSRSGEEGRDNELMKTIWTHFLAVLIALSVLAVIVAGTGVSFDGALLAASSALSNIGPAYDFLRLSDISGAPPYGEMNDVAQIALCIGMILGRVEIIALISLLTAAYWRR